MVRDAAPLGRVRWAYAVDGCASVGEFDPPVVSGDHMGRRGHVRLQQDPVLLQRQDPVLRQSAVWAGYLRAIQPARLLLCLGHTARFSSLVPET